MKILLINYEYPPIGGGGGIASRNLVDQWKAQNHEVHVLTSTFLRNNKNKSKANLLSLLFFPVIGTFKGIKLCRKIKFDVINTHFAIPSGPVGYVLSKLFKIKNILSVHGADIYDPTRNIHNNFILKPVIKFILNHADQIVAQSINIKENAVKYYQPNKSIKIIPLGFVVPNIKKNKGATTSTRLHFDLISIGRLVPRKGYNYLIESLKDTDKNIHLNIIGSGPEKQNLLNLIKQLNLESRIEIIDNADEQKKWQYLFSSDCYVLSSLHEGYGIVCQEAMYAGLPIIATNYGGQTDYLKENHNAILIKPKNTQALTWAINKIDNQPELRNKLSENNKQDIKQYYVENIGKQYLKIFI